MRAPRTRTLRKRRPHATTAREWVDGYADAYEIDLLVADGWDDAILGIATQAGRVGVVYDAAQILKTLVERDKMTHDEAVEFFEFNIVQADVGAHTPVFFVPWGDGDRHVH